MRAAPAIIAAVVCAGVSAGAHPALEFFQSQQQRVSAPLDIRPGGAIPVASPFIRGRLKCAENVNAWLRRNGYRGTGSATAKSFMRYGVAASGPAPGVIQIENRGRNRASGHVQIVSHKQDGVWMCKNPSSRAGQWVINRCANPRVIAYRMPTEMDMERRSFAVASRLSNPARYAVNRDRNAPIPAALSFGPGIVPASSWSVQSYGVIR